MIPTDILVRVLSSNLYETYWNWQSVIRNNRHYPYKMYQLSMRYHRALDEYYFILCDLIAELDYASIDIPELDDLYNVHDWMDKTMISFLNNARYNGYDCFKFRSV